MTGCHIIRVAVRGAGSISIRILGDFYGECLGFPPNAISKGINMARIKSIKINSTVHSVHPTEVDCEVRRVAPATGGVLLQLSTFGSKDRQSEPKVSQTIQLDREAALRLRALIDETFGDS